MRSLLLLSCLLTAQAALAQDEPRILSSAPSMRVASAVAQSGALDSWERDMEQTDEPVAVQISLSVRVDSAGTVSDVEVVSAPGVSPTVREEIAGAVRGLLLPELPGYEGPLSFTMHYAPGEARPLSPWVQGLLAGLTVGLTAIVLALLE